MNWKNLETETELNNLVNLSFTKPQAIFKHSTRCSISIVAKNRLDKNDSNLIDFYYLDLLLYRNLSNLVAEKWNVYHESPQVILIKNGICIYDESHSSIYFDDIIEAVN
jgi:bacillithiol system protein YtxJ